MNMGRLSDMWADLVCTCDRVVLWVVGVDGI